MNSGPEAKAAMTLAELAQILAGAIHRNELSSEIQRLSEDGSAPLDPDAKTMMEQAARTLEVIAAQSSALAEAVSARLRGMGVRISEGAAKHGSQYQQASFAINAGDLTAAIQGAADEGFDAARMFSGGAVAALRNLDGRIDLMRRDDVCSRLVFNWKPSAVARAMPRQLRPALQDYVSVGLPAALCPLYPVVKVARVALPGLGRGRKREADFLPPASLGTPLSLVEPLGAFAGLTADDHLVDVGCGDGRFLIEAVRQTGCRATGIEADPACARYAAKAADQAGLSGKVDIITGMATAEQIRAGTLVFGFHPPGAQKSLFSFILEHLQPGARLLTHEQLPLAEELSPDWSAPLFGTDALTVAHLWTA